MESSIKITEDQEEFSEEIQEIVDREVLKAKKALLNELVRLEILNYSRHDGIYFKMVKDYLVIVSEEIDVWLKYLDQIERAYCD